MDNRRLSELVVFRAAGLAPEEGASVILPGRMPGDSSRYANGMPDGWGVGDERPSDEYIACHIALDALRNGNHGADGRIDSDLFARLRDGEGLQEWLDAGGDPWSCRSGERAGTRPTTSTTVRRFARRLFANRTVLTLCKHEPYVQQAGASNSEVYADPRLRRPAAERAPVDALDARAADGVAAVHEGNGF